MTQSIREVMTANPTAYPATTSIADAARAMRDSDVGDVLVETEGALCGLVTDRDIARATQLRDLRRDSHLAAP